MVIKTPKNPIIIENTDNMSAEEILDKHFERKKPVTKKKKDVLKLEKQIIKEVKEKEKQIDRIIKINHEPIEFIIKETSYFKPNWFYFKRIFLHIQRFIIYPYQIYACWFNAKFNLKLSKIKILEITKDDNENLYESKRPEEIKESVRKLNKKTDDKMFEIVRSEK